MIRKYMYYDFLQESIIQLSTLLWNDNSIYKMFFTQETRVEFSSNMDINFTNLRLQCDSAVATFISVS